MKRSIALLLVLIFVAIAASGCGETVNGVRRDASRIVKGVKTVFVSGE